LAHFPIIAINLKVRAKTHVKMPSIVLIFSHAR